jgi:hypothetical protein
LKALDEFGRARNEMSERNANSHGEKDPQGQIAI